jgi:sortase A
MYKLFYRYARKLSTVIIVLLFSASLWQLATANWIQGKAILAQHLLNTSWNKTLASSTLADPLKPVIHKPWPWADTWPVAKLIVPEYEIEQIILAGDSGSSLAFGPGYSLASAAPKTIGTTLISGHRDTHFKFLKDLKINDTIYLQTTDETIGYQVYDLKIVNSKTFTLPSDGGENTLVLVTCYPFEALSSGGLLRYLVYAVSPMNQNKVSI